MRELFNLFLSRIEPIQSDVCKDYWYKLKRLEGNYTNAQAAALLFDNIEWIIKKGIVNPSEIEKMVNHDLLAQFNIHFFGRVNCKDNQCILFGDAIANVSGFSRVRMFDNSQCFAEDSTFISAYDQSMVDAKNCKILAFDSCTVNSRGFCLIEDYTDGNGTFKIDIKKDLKY